MTIDIQPGDTFTILETGYLYQWRNGLCRSPDKYAGVEWVVATHDAEDHRIDPTLARQIITAAGHTITETTPPAAPVPWPKYAVISELSKCIIRLGTEADCRNWIACEGDTEAYTIRPLAAAPLSPAERAAWEKLGQWTKCPDLKKQIQEMLDEGGGR